MKIEELSFEDAARRLDEIVKALEKGEAPLKESMKLFEEATALAARCETLLNEAEQQVVRLKKGPDGAPEELPFEAEE